MKVYRFLSVWQGLHSRQEGSSEEMTWDQEWTDEEGSVAQREKEKLSKQSEQKGQWP